ncbi:MAG TPA: tetratricopeptide repeat protein, partial [Candidatus Melainabacteria bacterium]|nr:tetratricopeptide repeat protein [Candidatus Melainabacteria bacterium]
YSRWVTKMAERFCGETALYSVQSAITLATICSETSKATEASEICHRLMELDRREEVDCLLLARLVPILVRVGRREDAERLISHLQSRIENAALDGMRDYNASAYYRLALANKHLGRLEESRELMAIAVAELEEETGADSIFLAFVLEDWADELKEANSEELAIILASKAANIRAKK